MALAILIPKGRPWASTRKGSLCRFVEYTMRPRLTDVTSLIEPALLHERLLYMLALDFEKSAFFDSVPPHEQC